MEKRGGGMEKKGRLEKVGRGMEKGRGGVWRKLVGGLEKRGGAGWSKLVGVWRKDVVFGNSLHHCTHMCRLQRPALRVVWQARSPSAVRRVGTGAEERLAAGILGARPDGRVGWRAGWGGVAGRVGGGWRAG